MSNSKQTDPLLEWNRLNKENAEQALVSATFKCMADTSPIVDKFSMWLLAGTGASGALLISRIEAVIPHLTATGFKWCLFFLIVSAILGFLAKYKSLRCQIQNEVNTKLTELMPAIFAKHKEDKTEIQEYAKQRGVALETDISLSKVIAEFAKPFPFWVRWLIERQVIKNQGNRQAGFHVAIKAYSGQLFFTFWQAVFFLAFLCAGAWYARGI
ncbi:MAG: hypothetical protein AABY45_04845 [Deltaproteobacteria bacterium]